MPILTLNAAGAPTPPRLRHHRFTRLAALTVLRLTAGCVSPDAAGDHESKSAAEDGGGLPEKARSMEVLSLAHARRAPQATHLTSAVVSGPLFIASGGRVTYGGGASGQDVIPLVRGDVIDHHFLRSRACKSDHRFILNTCYSHPVRSTKASSPPLTESWNPRLPNLLPRLRLDGCCV